MTKGNSVTYTLSGFAGCKIKSLSMSMKSNSKGGSGTFSLTAGSTTLAEIVSATAFNNTAWNGSWSTSYVNITPTMTNNNYIIQSSEDIVLTISASANSLFCQSITLTYEESTLPSISANNVDIADDATSGEIAYTISNPVEGKSLVASKKSDVDWISNVAVDATNSKITFTSTPNTNTISREATITLNYGEGTATKEVKVTQAAGPYTTIADLFTKATEVGNTDTDVKITFGDWVVSAVNGNTAYVTDGEKGFILYNSSGHSFDVGDIISGTAKAKLNLRNGSANVQGISANTDGITKTTGGALTPREVSIDQLSGVNTGSIITINNVTYNGTAFTDGTNTIKPYKDFYEGSYATGKKYNMTGMYLQYNTTKEILPRNESDIYEIPAIKYEISITPSTNGAVTVDAADNKAQEGQTVTMTITPDEHYQLSTLTVTDASSKPVTVTDNKFTMPASDVTVSATFAELPKYTVTVSDGDESWTEYVDETIELISRTSTNPDYTFVGWSETKVADETTDAPTLVANPYTVSKTVCLYPVYKRSVVGSPENQTVSVSIADYAKDNNWSNGSQYTTIELDDNISVTATNVGNTAKYYTSGENWRMYQTDNSTWNVIATNDAELTSVKFTYGVNNNGILSYNNTTYASDSEIKLSGNASGNFTVVNSGTANNGQVQISAIEVKYTIAATTNYFVSVVPVKVTITKAGWATACIPFDATVSGDVTAYYVTVKDGKLIQTPIEEDEHIAAETGILLKSNSGNETKAVFTQVALDEDKVGDAWYDNMLIGTTKEEGEDFEEPGCTYYILSDGENGVGFYWDGENYDEFEGAGAHCNQYKAVLAVPTGSGAPSFFTFDDATAINGISSVKTSGVRYNLNGQAVGEDYKGIVIVNGKKMFNK